jgi:hypothetical protein
LGPAAGADQSPARPDPGLESVARLGSCLDADTVACVETLDYRLRASLASAHGIC